MKKIFVLLVVLATALTANAQFEKGKAYLGASLSGFDISSHRLRNSILELTLRQVICLWTT